VARSEGGRSLWRDLRQLYAERGYKPGWTWKARPTTAWDLLLGAIEAAGQQALDPALYDIAALRRLREEAQPQGLFRRPALRAPQIADTELRLSQAFLRYASHLRDGLTVPGDVDRRWPGNGRPNTDLKALLSRALIEGRPDEVLRTTAPRNGGFLRLLEAWHRYQALAQSGGWVTVPAAQWSAEAHAGETLRKRLAAEGDLVSGRSPGDELRAAIRRFQRRHGLEPTGELDAPTRAALSTSAAERLRQIELTLERWRWLPEDLGPRYLIVNIPAYELYLVEGGRVELSMKVIVGSQETSTPVFSDTMTHVVFSPSWYVPESIVTEELIPRLEENPTFLEEQGIEVSREGEVVSPDEIDPADLSALRFRQPPGPANALGSVKFLFPNHFNIYLHDTPAEHLFAYHVRTLSHGCIRLEKPRALAQHVLREEPEWTPEKIEAAMQAGHEKAVKLRTPIPVHIVYWTSWIDQRGAVQFRNDVYGHDAAHRAALEKRMPGQR
jgi:murein L,D-transpeptidase YcbB/YkuD